MKPDSKPDELSSILVLLAGAPSDETAWRRLYEIIWPFISSIAFRRLKNRGAAEDVSQEVLLRLMKAQPFKHIREPSEFRAYIARMTLNAANTFWRADHRLNQAQELTYEISPTGFLAEPSISPDDYLALKQAIRKADAVLDSQDVKLLNLILDGQSLTQAAETLAISYSNAAVRLHRAKNSLRKLLKYND
jgi:RNA polymerase sigma factor (sigma-70 family)